MDLLTDNRVDSILPRDGQGGFDRDFSDTDNIDGVIGQVVAGVFDFDLKRGGVHQGVKTLVPQLHQQSRLTGEPCGRKNLHVEFG